MIPQIQILSLNIPTYLLTLSAVYCLMIYYFLARIKASTLRQDIGVDLLIIIMVSGFVGARLFYIIYMNPSYYFDHPLEIFMFWNGGFVFFGGLGLGLLMSTLFLKYKAEALGQWMSLAAPVLALGYGLGRLACFFNGCCYGEVCTLPWAMKFPHLEGLRHPTQLYAVIFALIVWVFLVFLEKNFVNKEQKKLGVLFYMWLCFHGLGRLFMEHFRDDPRGAQLLGMSISSFISLCLMIWGLSFLFKHLMFKQKYKPKDH